MNVGTPIKQREYDRDFCLVCGKFAKEARRVETIRKLKGKDYSLKDLLNKYGGLNVESGTVCRKCSKKVDNLHKQSTDFYNECQKNAGISKRMASSPHIIPPKRINMSTPKPSTQNATDFCESEDDISIIGLHSSDAEAETDQVHVSGILSLQYASSSASFSDQFALDSLTSMASSESAISNQTDSLASIMSMAISESATSNETGSCSTSVDDHMYSKKRTEILICKF